MLDFQLVFYFNGGMWFSVYLLVFVSGVVAIKITDEEYATFPPHFHMDDYKMCLSKRNGLYCLGTFELVPIKEPHHTFELMKEYNANDEYTFNRTLIRRGYCVSARCPIVERNSTKHVEQNTTRRFERCVSKWGQKHEFRPKLQRLHYCRTHNEVEVKTQPTPDQTLFVQVIYAILALNVVGTIYDVMSSEKTEKKNRLLVAWSLPANWRRLTATYNSDPRLNDLLPIQGLRVIGLLSIIYGHCLIFHYFYYTRTPDYLEKFLFSRQALFLSKGTVIVYMYMIISVFLTAYNLRLYAQKKSLSLHILPVCILKRYIRIAPVTILLVGYAATWWSHTARDGPLISYSIGVESEICKQKFWYQVFFLNNIIDRSNFCLAPTWFLAADMHLFILTCVLMIIMWSRHEIAIKVYPVLIIGSCLANAVIKYLNGWKSIHLITQPENLRIIYRNESSFSDFYMSSWAALPCCFVGLLMSHLHYDFQQRKIDISKSKLLVFWHAIVIIVEIVLLIELGRLEREYKSPLIGSVISFVDQILFYFNMSIFLLGLFHIKGSLSRFFAWRGWEALGRLSLAVMLIHWIVGVIIAARPYAFHASALDTKIDWIATSVLSYLIAVPVTIMVDTPMQKFLGALINL